MIYEHVEGQQALLKAFKRVFGCMSRTTPSRPKTLPVKPVHTWGRLKTPEGVCIERHRSVRWLGEVVKYKVFLIKSIG